MNSARRLGIAAGLAMVALGQAPLAQRLQRIDVPTAVVAYRDVHDQVITVASVATDEATASTVAAHFVGWIEQVFANTTYQRIERGQPLFTVYSPDLYAAEQEYLFAAENRGRLASSPVAGVAAGAASLLGDARARLEQQQVPSGEIARLERTGVAQARLTIVAPSSGIVTERDALPNMRMEPGTRLYAIAALTPIWIYAAVNESDLGRIRVGQAVTVAMDAFPGRAFHARVDFIVPQVDVASRTGRVRIVLPNADRALVPGMYGSATIEIVLGRQLVIPASAVLQTGARPLTFVDHGGGELEPRPVELGARVGDNVVVLHGLRAGERVATSASFLIASEAQLSAAAGSYAPPPPGVGQAARPGAQMVLTTAPSPPRKGANTFRVRLTSAQGAPIAGAQVTVTLFMPAMPAMGMAEMKAVVRLADHGGGLYAGQGRLDSSGNWRVTIAAFRGGQSLAVAQTSLRVPGGM